VGLGWLFLLCIIDSENFIFQSFYYDGIFVSGELWEYWLRSFPSNSTSDMFEDVERDIDDEDAEFTRSLA
jgi:hypothetical protein